MSETPWQDLFTWSDGPYYGYVSNFDDALDIIQEFSYSTSTSYVVPRTSKDFGNFDITAPGSSSHHIRFQDYLQTQHGSKIDLHGTPFMVTGVRNMECHQGPNHRKSLDEHQSTDHSYMQASHKNRCTGSKKRGCPAIIYLRELIAFPTYKLEKDTPFHRRAISARLRRDLHSSSYDDIETKRLIYIDLPPTEKHTGHIMGENAFALSKGVPPESLAHRHAIVMRQYALSKLLLHAKPPPSQRTTCDMIGCCKPGQRERWVCCDVCGRWSHFKCVNISKNPEGDYVCPICTAQYE